MDSIREIVDKLYESKVGAFFIVNGYILSNNIDVRKGESYGDFVNYSSHWDLWRAAQRAYPQLRGISYDTYPRGRVVYNKKTNKYIIYLDPKLNNEIDLELITIDYKLSRGSYVVDDKDEHYQSDDNAPTNVYLDEDYHFEGNLNQYIDRDTY